MRATGIVRRIDELGRVVIPKEIRRTLRIREGDPLLTTGNEMDVSAIFGLFASVIATGFIRENRRENLRHAGRNAGFFRCPGLHIRLETCYNNDEY